MAETARRIAIIEFGSGPRALDRLRAATHDVCDVAPIADVGAFRSISVVTDLTAGLLLESQCSPVECRRTPRHIARGAIDHYQVAMYLDGTTELSAGRRTARLVPGDVVLIDMADANHTRMLAGAAGRCHVLTLAVPRPVLAPLLASPDGSSATRFAGATQEGRIIGGHLMALRGHRGWTVPPAAAVGTVAALVASAAGCARDAGQTARRAARAALLDAIKRHIEAHLDGEPVTADRLGRRFGLSRATLYRLFEADGGLVRYIQDCRLQRAFRLLMSPAARDARLIDLALDHAFASDNTFIRAFRRRYGMTPGDVRALAAAGARERARSGAVSDGDAFGWLRHLRAT